MKKILTILILFCALSVKAQQPVPQDTINYAIKWKTVSKSQGDSLAALMIRSASSYSNPSWITGLAWSKLTSTPTTASGYGITNIYTKSQIDSLLLLKASATRTYNLSARTLNSAFQPSTTHDCIVIYYVQITSTLSLSGGQSGSVQLQTSPTNSVYTNTGTNTNNNTGSLTIGLNTAAVQTACLVSYVPAGYYVKLVTSGASAFAYQTGIEILL